MTSTTDSNLTNEYLLFRVHKLERFQMLSRVFEQLRHDKAENVMLEGDLAYLHFFDEAAKTYFWWPTPEEGQIYQKLWDSTPWQERSTTPELQKSWDFDSMILAFKQGAFELERCFLPEFKIGRLEFRALSYPYGGVDCMVALLECFGFEIFEVDDGTSVYTWPLPSTKS